ncbi:MULTISPECIES: NadS family protein [Psychromonas]|uniref:NadS family protein n=1 Tax=Psychromonas TaxID=67572 RepID=UPI000412DA9F|nr:MULTISPECIES: NadS family protein [Psychromonas]MBB1273190.1 transcriptional regulator [Psychromonas sp. SR45-3]
MKDELFEDLLASANEMLDIETGSKNPEEKHIHVYDTLDVKAIREASGKDRKEFAEIIGASYDSVCSWESKRRNPSGVTKKLLTLIKENPEKMVSKLEFS